MNTKRFVMAVAAVFVFIFAFEWIWHGMLMMESYQATAQLWRPMDQMNYFHFMILSQIGQALVLFQTADLCFAVADRDGKFQLGEPFAAAQVFQQIAKGGE